MNKVSKKSSNETQAIEVVRVAMGHVTYCLLGSTPLIMNRMAEKARQELLMPARKKNQAERSVTLKHNPTEEFRLSIYRTLDEKSPTWSIFPGNAFASALADTAIDIPGASKAQIQRLARVSEINVPLFGIPQLFMAVVRTAGMNKTPDIRTRAIFPEWACFVTIDYVKGLLTEKSVTNLFAAAGLLCGVGDWRGQKGGPYGQFRCVEESNKDFQRIIKTQGRKAQEAALENIVTYDLDSDDLYSWWQQELIERERSTQDDPVIIRGSNGGEVNELERALV